MGSVKITKLIILLLTITSTKIFSQHQPKALDPPKYLEKIIAHYNKRLTHGLDVYGDDTTGFWMASLNTYTGVYPEDNSRPPHIPQRAYLDRYVDAPKGATLYWDMPAVVTAYALSDLTGSDWYREKAENYMEAFLERCVAKNGVFLWGNHYYYDAFQDTTMRFGNTPTPVDFAKETGDYHEIRPLAPAWEALWKVAPEATAQEIRKSVDNHIADDNTGEFNRHADTESGHAFIEAGGVLIYSLAWLYEKTGDESLLQKANKMAEFSFNHRNEQTGLLANEPVQGRWDSRASTTEVGLWAGCLLEAAERADEYYADQWISMADKALTDWLNYGYDTSKNKYYGMLEIATGDPVFREEGDDYPYKPGNYSDIWEPLFPTHNYPITLAESCLKLYELTGKELYHKACERWVEIIRNSLPARDGKGAYAEHYGRVIHFLLNCAEKLNDPAYKKLADKIGQEAVDVLFAHDMFRSHPGEYRYDAVDGVGMLSLSLLWLETGKRPDMMGLFF